MQKKKKRDNTKRFPNAKIEILLPVFLLDFLNPGTDEITEVSTCEFVTSDSLCLFGR